MNSIHRIGVGIATAATVLTVAGAFVAQGYVAALQASIPTATTGATAGPTATLAPEIVYVNPAPSPQVINVTQTQSPTQTPPVVHVVVAGPVGDDGGRDGGDN